MAKELKKYQPERKDLLINTDWGIPGEDLSGEQAREQGLSLYLGRYVTDREWSLLQEQRFAYQRIKLAAAFWFIIGLWVLPYTVFEWLQSSAARYVDGAFVVATLCLGIGLLRFWRAAWYISAVLSLILLTSNIINFARAVMRYGLPAAGAEVAFLKELVSVGLLVGIFTILFQKWVRKIFRI